MAEDNNKKTRRKIIFITRGESLRECKPGDIVTSERNEKIVSLEESLLITAVRFNDEPYLLYRKLEKYVPCSRMPFKTERALQNARYYKGYRRISEAV